MADKVIVDLVHRWAHVSIPKCACTSIRRALERHFKLKPASNPHAIQWPETRPREWLASEEARGFCRWAVLREPADRLYAVWYAKMREPKGYWRKWAASCGTSFERFVHFVATLPVDSPKCERHIRSQRSYLTVDGKCVVPTLMDFTQLRSHWVARMRLLQVLPELPHLHRGDHPPSKDVITPELRAVIEDVYAKDYRIYGHSWTLLR